ncbi:MAG: signal recognition particle-docking protein FtsY [Sphingobacteriia bacterium]
MGLFDVFKRGKKNESLHAGLSPTRRGLLGRLAGLLGRKSPIDAAALDELEEILMLSDVGLDTTLKIIERIQKRAAKERATTAEIDALLREEIAGLLVRNDKTFDPIEPDKRPYVLMVVGVNGVGKTTTNGKLAYQFKAAGNRVMLGAADTFRAAAVDQLKIWGERVGVPVVDKGMGADPASVAYEATQAAVQAGVDVLIIDTAGRLHNKKHLMDELGKIKRTIARHVPGAPHEVLLVLDGSTGQNALAQAREFTEATEVSALAITKLDGTAKGGVVIGISDQFQIPVRYIGVGEGMEDLQRFEPAAFVDSLFEQA